MVKRFLVAWAVWWLGVVAALVVGVFVGLKAGVVVFAITAILAVLLIAGTLMIGFKDFDEMVKPTSSSRRPPSLR